MNFGILRPQEQFFLENSPVTIRLTPIAAAIFLSSVLSSTVFAASEDAATKMQLDELSSQAQSLQSQLSSLNKEMSALKKQIKASKPKHYVLVSSQSSKKTKKKRTRTVSANNGSDDVDEGDDHPVRLSGRDIIRLIREEKQYLPFDLDVPGQAFVSTGPYVGVPIQYSGSNLIVNSPSVNTDVQLLQIRKSIHQQLMAMGGEIFQEPYHSHLLLSGVVSGQANYINRGGMPSTSNLDITNVALDAFFIGPSDWTLGFIEFGYDSSAPISNGAFTSTSNYRVSNSRVYVNKAFATIGDLSKSPLYGSFGQFFVPFGTYSSVMISDRLTTLLTRTKARSILLGYQQQKDNAAYASIFAFRGDSHAASVSKINNAGVNVGYKYTFKDNLFNGNFGAGLIGNIADSGGMQLGTGFKNFEQLSHNVPGYNLRGLFGLGESFDLIGELVGSTTAFNVNDMSYNGRGAKPWAIDLQAVYTFKILDNRPSSVGVGYDHSYESLAVGMPMSRMTLVMTTSLMRNSLQAIELRHDTNYAASATANGPVGAASITGACTAAACTSTGKGDNAITASFDYYF